MPDRIYFFFSSRRRHTRYWRDWSSDVCSSDLVSRGSACRGWKQWTGRVLAPRAPPGASHLCPALSPSRSEERRVGKECRSRCTQYHHKKINKEEGRYDFHCFKPHKNVS